MYVLASVSERDPFITNRSDPIRHDDMMPRNQDLNNARVVHQPSGTAARWYAMEKEATDSLGY